MQAAVPPPPAPAPRAAAVVPPPAPPPPPAPVAEVRPAAPTAPAAETPSLLSTRSGDFAGRAAGTRGLSMGLPSGGAPTVGFTYFLSPDGALRADLGLAFAMAPAVSFAFSLEAGYRAYVGRVGKLHPFLQPGVYVGVPNGKFSMAITGGVGVEYYFTEQLAVGGVTGLAFLMADNFGTVKLTTGTSALFASFYW